MAIQISSWFQEVKDSGPIYKETVMNRFPVEPFNTVSNLVFLATIIYFTYLIHKSSKKHWFLRVCMPVFFIGYVGGTLYHATRSAEIWLLMDWVPIVILCLACAIYFVLRAPTTWINKVVLVGAILGLNILPRIIDFPTGYGVSMGYMGTAAAVILPIAMYGRYTQWRNFKYVVLAVASFALAVSFRTIDRFFDLEFLYMGTHWLWHTMGGVAVFFLMYFIYLDNEKYERL
jgi:hemolysin III